MHGQEEGLSCSRPPVDAEPLGSNLPPARLDQLRVVVARVDVEQHVRVGTANYVRWCAANPYPARFLLAMRHQEFLENPDLPRQVAEETSKGSVELIRIGQSEGSIRSGDPEFLAHMYSAPAQKMVQMKLELGIGGDLVEMADAAGDLAWRMVCQPIEPEEREM